MKPMKKTWNNIWATTHIRYPHDIILLEIEKMSDIKKILEVGAGSGRDLEELSKRNYDVTYSDFSPVAIKKFRDRNPSIKTINCDARNLLFEDNKFDLVYSLGLLEHFGHKDRRKVIQEMFRVSSRYVLIDVPQRYSLATIGKKILILFKKWKYGEETEFSYKELLNEVKEAGLDFEVVSKYGRELIPLPRNFKNKFYQKFPSFIKRIYLKILAMLYWGITGSFGIVFKKN